MSYKSGYIGVFGRPNVGKSTLLNGVIGEKVSIVSAKPQTTRDAILGIRYEEDAEFLFLDTPGFERTGGPLHFHMKGELVGAFEQADVAVMMVTPPGIKSEDKMVISEIKKRKVPMIGVINKIDLRSDKGQLLPLIEELIKLGFGEVIPISALKKDGLDILIKAIKSKLPEGEKQWVEDSYTDRSTNFLVSELVREQIFEQLRQELPYGSTVTIDSFEKREEQTHIMATIHVNKASHKGIVLGKRGVRIKEIGTKARKEILKIVPGRVHLELFVRVTEGWTRKQGKVTELLNRERR